jgi:hypothetical protein
MGLNRYWFAPKAFGFGSGLPISWEGWAVSAAFLLLIFSDIRLLADPWRTAGLIGLFVLFAAICACTTEGGWRWRWGRE